MNDDTTDKAENSLSKNDRENEDSRKDGRSAESGLEVEWHIVFLCQIYHAMEKSNKQTCNV